MVDELLQRARSGERTAFDDLVAPHHDELLLHCYRMLGSYQDAEDALQETLLAAWLGLAGFEGRSSLRTWLYRVATNRALNFRRTAGRRERTEAASLPVPVPIVPRPTGSNEVVWLQPFPDHQLTHLDQAGDEAARPDVLYERREAVSLALMRLLQLLPPQQRAVLVLRDVLGYRAREVADLLDTSEDATNGALRRARATLAASGGAPGELDVARLDPAGPDAALLDRFAQAFLSGDVSELVSLFTDDVWLRMPPLTLEYQGPLAAAAFFSAIGTHRSAVVRLVATSCNQQPAWGEYTLNPSGEVMHLAGVLVAGLRNGRICALTRFDIFSGAVIGLPRTIET